MSTIQEEGNGKKRIVIVGAGFAGLYTYMELHNQFHGRDDIFITVINKSDYFLFVPMVHEVAVGNLMPGSITQSLRVLPQCCLNDFIEAEVESVDFDTQKIVYQASHKGYGDENTTAKKVLEYDYLVLSPGAQTNYFGVEGAPEHTITLQNLNDAKQIKNTILHRFEEAQTVSDDEKKRELLRFIVIGGGATGVELVGEMADIFQKELQGVYPSLYPHSSIVLVHGGAQLLSDKFPLMAKRAKNILEKKGKVEIMLSTRATKIEKGVVWMGDKKIQGSTIVWAGGVVASSLTLVGSRDIQRNERDNRLITTRTLNLSSYPNIFALGDFAWVPQKNNEKESYPTRAQFATREGYIAGRNIKKMIDGEAKSLEEFDWSDQGFIVSLGRGGALAKIGGIHFSGFIAWWLYRTIYLFKMFGARAKFRTAFEWTMNLFLPRDLSEL